MSTEEELLARIRQTPPLGGNATTAEEQEEESEEESPTPGTDPDDESEGADDPEGAESELERLKAQFAEKEKNLERGFQKKMQKLSAWQREQADKFKASREVDFIAQHMLRNAEFADEFRGLAQKYGVRMPDVTSDDIEEKVNAAVAKVLERLDERDDTERAAGYNLLIQSEVERIMAEYGVTAEEADKVFLVASDKDVPLLRPGMSPAQVRKAVDLAAAAVFKNKAAANAQRKLLTRSKDKVRSAAALAGKDAPPTVLRAQGFHESPEAVLAKIRGG